MTCVPFTGREAQRCEMRLLLRTASNVGVRSACSGMYLTIIATGLVAACTGCAATRNYSEPTGTSRTALRAATVPADQVVETTAVVQAQHLAVSEGASPATAEPAAAEKSEAIPSPLPAPALTLDQTINLCLTNDPENSSWIGGHQPSPCRRTHGLAETQSRNVAWRHSASVKPSHHAGAARRAVGV